MKLWKVNTSFIVSFIPAHFGESGPSNKYQGIERCSESDRQTAHNSHQRIILTFCKHQHYVRLYAVYIVGIYFATFVIYCILCKEKYMEQFNSDLAEISGKTMQLVQFWLTKNEKV
jgi:hypothetical protein